MQASARSLPNEHYVSGKWRAFVPGAGVAQGRKVCSFKESFTRAKQDRRKGDVQLSSGQGPRTGPNMFLPRIQAPMF